jgi:hypothetical protein
MRRPGASTPTFYSRRWAGNGGGAESVASGAAPLMAAQSRKRRCSLFLMQATESARGVGDEAATLLAGGPPGERGRARMDCTVSPRRHKPRPNLGHVCVAAGRLPKMRWAPIKIGPIQASAVCLRWAVGDTLAP